MILGWSLTAHGATLAVVCQYGFTHSACRLEYDDGKVEWVGFIPETRSPVQRGIVDSSSLEEHLKEYVLFRVDNSRLLQARELAAKEFHGSTYILGTHDCVSFAIKVCEQCGLRASRGVKSLTPENLVAHLTDLNEELAWNVRPLAWLQPKHPPGAPRPLRITSIQVKCHQTETVTGPDKIFIRIFNREGRLLETSARSINNGQQWTQEGLSLSVQEGEALCVQLWDDDRYDSDDLVFDWSFLAAKDLPVTTQERGSRASGSRSVYGARIAINQP